MSSKLPNAKVTASLAGITFAILALVPFHAFLTVWLASGLGHYTSLRLWKEFLLILLMAGGVYLLVKNPKLRWKLVSYKLHWLIAAYALLMLIWGVVALMIHQVDAKAMGYAWIVNLRFLIFFLTTWAIAVQMPKLIKMWPAWVLWPLAVVSVVALLQFFVLPYDVLRHFGYSESTIFPYETINHNIHHLRVMSTLRGANPLGAYLVLGLSLVAVLWAKRKKSWWLAGLFVLGLAALYLTFSRSAWIGLVLAVAVIIWARLKTNRARELGVSAAIVLAGITVLLFIALRHSANVQDTIFHTDTHSTIATSSNEGHATALKKGVMDLAHDPFGRGPGTAGPASVYNNHPARIAENYFLQIGQESGWLGLLLFVAINLVVGRALWRRRGQALALGLFASLVGITFINLLSHAWTDDTLAYLWWGLAGLAIATEPYLKDHEI